MLKVVPQNGKSGQNFNENVILLSQIVSIEMTVMNSLDYQAKRFEILLKSDIRENRGNIRFVN